MKNYFKRFSIMFVMLLAVLGVGIIGDGNVVNAATVGQSLAQPEDGWKRYDDDDTRIQYNGNWVTSITNSVYIGGTGKYMSNINNGTVTFKFYGTKIRFINFLYNGYSKHIRVTIDGIVEEYSGNSPTTVYNALVYEKIGLSNGIHTIQVTKLTNGDYKSDFWWDAIDIDDTGYLVDPNAQINTISLNNSILNLHVGDTHQLTATTTPAGAEVVWLSSDSSIATVDSTGKVTVIKEGQATITAQIKGSETKATCTVNVTKGGATEPTNPTEPKTGDVNLFIELVDGNIKQAQDVDVADFIKWFKNRDLDNNDNPIYKIKNAKGNVEYLVHDKVVAFEIR